MEIQGKVIQICEPQKFNGRNGEFSKFGFVIETIGQFARKVHFQVFGDERWASMAIQLNEELNVSFDVSSREWQGKWFTSCDAWRVLRNTQQANATPPVAQQAQPAPQAQTQTSQPTSATSNDDLPF